MEENVKYKCEKCNTSYSAISNYKQHLTTQKHKKKSGEILECSICGKVFQRKFNYDRHLLNVHEGDKLNNDNDDDTITDKSSKSSNLSEPSTDIGKPTINIDKLSTTENPKVMTKYDKDLDMLNVLYKLEIANYKNKLLKQELIIQKERYEKKIYKQKSEIHEKDKIFAQDIAKTTAKTTETAVNGLTYAKEHYSNAPELKKLDLDSCDELCENDRLIERLLFYSDKGKIADYLGDFIIKFYKKNDPNDQSLWTTDLSRLTFIVRQILKKKADWKYDKKGIKVCKIIINPLLENIKSILKKYINDIDDEITGKNKDHFSEDEDGYESEGDYERHKNPPELDNNDKLKLVNSQKTAVQIITDIDNKSLAKNIVKYISPHLSITPAKD